MTDRQAGNVAALAGSSRGLETGSEDYITLFQKLLEDDLDDELLQAVSGNSDLTVYELIRKLQRRYTDSANVTNRSNVNKPAASEGQTFSDTTRYNAKHGLPDVSDFFISQEALERLASEAEKRQSPPASQKHDDEKAGKENARPAAKKRTTKVGGSLTDESDNAVRQENFGSAAESVATESLKGLNLPTHPASFKVVSRDNRQSDEDSDESRNNEYRNVINVEDAQESSEVTKGYSQDSGYYSRLLGSNVDSATAVRAESSPEKPHTCGSCGHEMPLKENGLCKNCWNRFKKEGNVRLGGTLDDFKAYAQCIAQSVRKMLDIRPAKSSEDDDTQYDNIIGDQSEVLGDANRTTNEVVLHRFNTDMSVKSSSGKDKAVFNRSVSCDGQISLPVREMKSVSPSKVNAVPDLSVDNRAKESLESKEVKKKPRTKLANKEDATGSELETKTEETTKTVSPRKVKTRKGLQRSKTSFDMKKVDIIPVSTKKLNSEKTDFFKRPQKTEKDIQNTLTVSKLLNEGTPVDPPHGREKRIRKTSVRRSATIPMKKGISEAAASSTTSTVSDARESRSTTKSSLRNKRVNLSLADVRTEEVGTLDTKRRSTSYDVMVMSRSRFDDFMDRSKTSSPACEEKRDCPNKPKEVQAVIRENISVNKPSPKQRTKLPSSRVAITSPSEQVYSGTTLKQAMSKEVPVEKPKYTEPPVPAPRGEKRRKAAAEEKDEAYCDGVKHLPADLETQLNTDTPVAVPSDVYTAKEPAISKSSCQYFNALQPAASARDRSHESKSSHAMSALRSSHSDDTLLRSQADVYYSRKGMIGETDVDTGLVHHFSKRQTSRNHVLPYFEFASGRNVYTSGDVSVSDSSHSGTSLKSEGSDNIYTGGFFKEAAGCDQEINGGDNSGDNVSVSSVSQIYFEPPQDGQKGEPSEHDLYTGGVFSTNQNANGSTNNSTRPLLSRVSRRYRGRPKIDRVLDRNMEITGIVQYKTSALYNPMEGVNCSNNSSNGPYYNYGASEQHKTPSPKVTQSDSSSYTGFGYRYQVQPSPQPKSDFKGIIDFSKYEAQETANTGFFFQTPKKIESDDIWYRGPYTSAHLPPSTMEQHVEFPSATKFPQHHDDDDCYTNIICPKFRNSNNNAANDATDQEDPDDANNNHFYTDDYTPDASDSKGASGSMFYEEPTSKYAPPQNNFFLKSGVNMPQSPPNAFSQEDHRPYSGSSPTRSYVPGFYGQAESAYTPQFSFSNAQQSPPDMSSFKKPPSYGNANAERTNAFYSAGQEDSWGVYEQSQQRSQGDQGVSSSDYVEMPRHRYGDEPANLQSERDSYFDYAASRNPSAGLFLDKKIEDFSSFMQGKSPPILPVVNEIKKVGGIVCRENVVNKEDYAEDVNRDLMDEPGAWVSYRYRDEEPKLVKELGGGRGAKMNSGKETVGKLARAVEDSSYAHNKIYDNVGARNNWREMNNDHAAKMRETKDSSRQKQQPGKAPEKKEKNVWRPSDQIPERAMGKRTQQHSSKPATVTATPPAPQQQQAPIPPTVLDGNNNTSQPDTARNPSSANTLSKCSSKKVNSSSGLDMGKKSNLDSETKQVFVDEMVFISPPDVPSNSHSENLKTTTWNLKPETGLESTQQERGLMDCRIM